MSELTDIYVKRGLWTNWSKGPVLGKTITTDIQTGTMIVSVLAILSSLAATHLWRLVIFATHQIRAHGTPSDGLYWQQQAILRSLPTPSSLLTGNFYLWWAWRRKVKSSLVRCWLQILFPILFILGALAITISTNYVVDTSSLEVLVKSPWCGAIQYPPDSSIWNRYVVSTRKLASDYASICYQEDSSSSALCRNTFIKDRLPLKKEFVDCPFDPSICVRGSKPAPSMDSGFIDSSIDMGMNVRGSDSVQFRQKTDCSVLQMEDRFSIVKAPNTSQPIYPELQPLESSAGIPRVIVSFGQSILLPESNPGIELSNNATFIFSDNNSSEVALTQRKRSRGGGEGSWTPIPELEREDADTAIISVYLNGNSFTSPVNDPFYSSHRRMKTDDGDIFLSDFLVGTWGCITQYQFCVARPSGGRECTELGGLPINRSLTLLSYANPTQKIQLDLIQFWIRHFDMNFAMTSGLKNKSAFLPRLPFSDTQWASDLEWWVSNILAILQIAVSDHAIGRNIRSKEPFIPPKMDMEKVLCEMQKMRKPGKFANINYFGLIFIIIVSSLIIILDLTIVQILLLVRRFTRWKGIKLNRWIQDSILHLQRRAFEAQEDSEWERLTEEVPTTESGEKLVELQCSLKKWNQHLSATRMNNIVRPQK
ncbi:hypothetical protein B0J11DRAFT_605443 [Dendryphion nanum]|uniref:Uncharacterized protein n=1 Tax=Dendryphion nanum TaxID=256645 RepID=A0A9P9DTV0_9PLEO|nr:hypothetical protein B0J11DRAFT_605443 [Dendryphion nanum]